MTHPSLKFATLFHSDRMYLRNVWRIWKHAFKVNKSCKSMITNIYYLMYKCSHVLDKLLSLLSAQLNQNTKTQKTLNKWKTAENNDINTRFAYIVTEHTNAHLRKSTVMSFRKVTNHILYSYVVHVFNAHDDKLRLRNGSVVCNTSISRNNHLVPNKRSNTQWKPFGITNEAKHTELDNFSFFFSYSFFKTRMRHSRKEATNVLKTVEREKRTEQKENFGFFFLEKKFYWPRNKA